MDTLEQIETTPSGETGRTKPPIVLCGTTLEQIEATYLHATIYKPLHISYITIDHEVVKDLCTLAKRGLATRKRPIAEAPKIDGVDLLVFGIQDGRPYTDIVRVSGNGFLAFDPLADRYCHESSGHTHFIPLSALEDE